MAAYKLKDICDKIGSGATPRGGKEAYEKEGISLIRSQNVLDFSLSFEGLAYINEAQAEKLNNVIVEPQDVLMNITGDSVARACIVDKTILPARVNQHVAIIRPNEKKILSSYLLYYLQMKKRYLLQLAAGGATRNALTKGMIEELEIELPIIEIQRKIVAVLDDIQKKIQYNSNINKNLERQLSEIYNDWYGKFKGSQNSRKTANDFGDIPAGWHYCQVGDLCKSISITHKFDKDELIFLNTGDIENGQILRNNYMNVKSMPGQAKKTIAQNDILYSEIRPINKHFAYVNFQTQDYVVSTKLMVIRTNNFDSRRLYHYLTLAATLNDLQTQAESRSGTFPQITFENISKLPILIADEKTETAFTTLLHSAYAQIDKNNLENNQLGKIRDALLPKLMSGELDVSAIDL